MLGAGSQPVVLGNTGGLTGTLEYSGATAASTRNFTMAAGGTGSIQVDTAATALTLSGTIDGSGGLVKAGPGTLVLSGSGTQGFTAVSAGDLRGTGTLSGMVICNNAATGSIWPGVATLGSAVPSSGEVLTVGGLALAGGKLKIALSTASATATQKLVVTGAPCDVSGATLALGIPQGVPPGNIYTVLDSATPIIGMFGSVTVNGTLDDGSRVTVAKVGNTITVQVLGGVTPVTVGSFSARSEASGVTLKWQSISEYQNAGFNVYRRTAESTSWTRVNSALIAGRITNADTKTYSFCDWVEPGVYEYKLESRSIFGQNETFGQFAGPIEMDAFASAAVGISDDGLDAALAIVETQSRDAFGQTIAARLASISADEISGGVQPPKAVRIQSNGMVLKSSGELFRAASVRSFGSAISKTTGNPDAVNVIAARSADAAALTTESVAPSIAARWFSAAASTTSTSTTAAKVLYENSGVLLIPASSLPIGFDAKHVAIQREGRTVTALCVTPEGVLLAAPGYEDDYTNKDAYFLRQTPAATAAGTVTAAHGLFDASVAVNTTTPASVTIDYHDVYFDYGTQFRPYNFAPWFASQYLTDGSTQRFSINAPSVSGGASALTLNLWSLTDDNSVDSDHALQVAINGQPVGQAVWDGGGKMLELTFQIPAGVLTSGANQVDLITPSLGGTVSQVAFLHSMTVAYTRALSGTKPLDIVNDSAQSVVFEVSDLPSAAAWVVDNRFPDRATLVSNEVQAQNDGAFRLRFTASNGGTGKFLIVPAGMENRPVTVSKRLVKALKSSAYLAVGPNQFSAGVQPLLAKRSKEGIKGQFADQEQLFDFYNYGRYGPAAIQKAVRAVRPQYLLLLGKTTYDYKNYSGLNVDPLCPAFLFRRASGGKQHRTRSSVILGAVTRKSRSAACLSETRRSSAARWATSWAIKASRSPAFVCTQWLTRQTPRSVISAHS